jgi:hypothetical protein
MATIRKDRVLRTTNKLRAEGRLTIGTIATRLGVSTRHAYNIVNGLYLTRDRVKTLASLNEIAK